MKVVIIIDSRAIQCIAIAVVSVYLILFGCVILATGAIAIVGNDQRVEISMSIQSVIHKSIYGEHTDVIGKTYSDDSIRLTLDGYVPLTINYDVKIAYHNEVKVFWVGPFLCFSCWGHVDSADYIQ